MKKSKNEYDVVIVGGGLAGMTMAALLGAAGVRVACLDQADPKVQMLDLRTTAISYGSSLVLEKAGIWTDMVKKACPIEDIEILDGDSPLLLGFSKEEVEGKAFGWIVENADLRKILVKKLKSLKTVTHLAPAKASDFETTDDHATAILDNGERLNAALIIGADGRQSFTRQWMDVETRQWSYKQRAIICCVTHENPHQNVAVEHFWPEGPFAVLPMADHKKQHRSSIVFTEHGPEDESLMRYSDAEFETALAARMPERYGDIRMIGQGDNKRGCYPLSLIHAASYIGDRMVLIADAAHGIHPIAGQGLNLGFRDVDALGTLLVAAHEAGGDYGEETLLQSYQRARRIDNMSMVAVTDGLVRLFSNKIPPIRALRRFGLKAVSKLKPAKQFFMRRAMGE